MRIYDDENKKSLTSILIMLTPTEVQELASKLKSLDEENDHLHIDDENYQRMITVGLYTPTNLYKFSEEVKRIILEDE